MTTLIYDKTFDGFLSAVFDVYEYRMTDVRFATNDDMLFNTRHKVITSDQNSRRVWKGLCDRMSAPSVHQLYTSFLSEQMGIEDMLMRYIRYAFDSKKSVTTDYSHEAVLGISQTANKVHREKHRMEAFVRFKLSKDGLYAANVEPDFNVLPLIVPHFKKRYADQRWMIYDLKRRYGIYYDLKTVHYITLTPAQPDSGGVQFHDDKEGLYQLLWKHYFKSVNIPSRKNMKLHIQHMPFRYWKHLIEKEPGL